MDDERWLPGMPVLDRQLQPEPTEHRRDAGVAADATPAYSAVRGRPAPILPPSLEGLPARSVPEARPTPLQRYYINLSVVGLVAGAIAITALELGTPRSSPLVKLCVLVGAPVLTISIGDAALRVWRSAWAWMPVNRGRGLFRLAWLLAIAVIFCLLAVAAWAVLTA